MADWNWDNLKVKKKKSGLNERIDEEDVNSSYKGTVVRSPLYHRFFEGYAESMVTLPNGKKKIIRTYVGRYYRAKGSDAKWLVRKIGYILFFFAALFCQIFAMTREAPCNMYSYGSGPWYTAAIGLCSAFPALILLANIFSCTFTKRDLTVYGYRLFDRLIKMSFLTALFNFAYCAAVAVFSFLNPSEWSSSVIPIVFSAAACGLYAAIGLTERCITYTYTESKNVPGTDGVIIS